MPGTKLSEQKLADIFGVSRTLVRQALNQLSRDRLVTLERARGAFVAMPSIEEAHEVFEVRQMLEATMVRRLARVDHAGAAGRAARAPARRAAGGGAHRRHRPHPPAGRLPRRAGAHARQPRADAAAGRPAGALDAGLADVPVHPFRRLFAGRTCGDRRRAGRGRRRRRRPARLRTPRAGREEPAHRPARRPTWRRS